MSDALEALDTLAAMYPLDGELELSPSTANALLSLRQTVEGEASASSSLPKELLLTIHVRLEACRIESLPLEVTLPTGTTGRTGARLGRNGKLQRAQWRELSDSLAAEGDRLRSDGFAEDAVALVSAAVSTLQELATGLLGQPLAPDELRPTTDQPEASGRCVRAWYRFPSLSTKTKRADLVSFALRHHLTGFVMAGKPGILCLECPVKQPSLLDDYMSEIKRISWSDIPAAHKKVSEVLRETDVHRVFPDMQEVTDDIGRRGEKANRAEGAQVAEWLRSRGIEDDVVRQVMMPGA